MKNKFTFLIIATVLVTLCIYGTVTYLKQKKQLVTKEEKHVLTSFATFYDEYKKATSCCGSQSLLDEYSFLDLIGYQCLKNYPIFSGFADTLKRDGRKAFKLRKNNPIKYIEP